MAKRQWDGQDAWRNHFSANAADLLQIQRVFAGEEVFQKLLRDCLMHSRSTTISERTVLKVLARRPHA